ncbi:hypothetical protein Fmac_015127 [Flemingia macrophylla]|uniref:Uncharacterized protein n=1 Tax=Flemingia macrophylla TaxID=520843 RepID=A0ABD1MDQ3_9FABA
MSYMNQTQSFATSTAKVGSGRSTKKYFGEKKKLPKQLMEHINDMVARKKTTPNIVDFPGGSSTKTNIIGYKRKSFKGEVTSGKMKKDKAPLPNRENKLKAPKAIDLDLNASPTDAG